MPRAQHKIRFVLPNTLLSCGPLPSPSLHQLPHWHLTLHSCLAMQQLKVLQRLSIGAGSPTPTSFHLLPSRTVLLLSSLLSPAYAHAVFIRTLPLCKVLLGLLRYCTNPKLLHFTVLASQNSTSHCRELPERLTSKCSL